MSSAKFYNKMDFPVKFRKVWEANSPAVELNPGNVIEGPYDMLSQYRFLSPVPFDFHLVESETMGKNGQFKDNLLPRYNNVDPVIISTPFKTPALITERHEPTPGAITTYKATPEPAISTPSEDMKKSLPFDPSNCNWVMIKVSELEKAAEILSVDISYTADMKPKDKKWELIRLIKKAVGLETKE